MGTYNFQNVVPVFRITDLINASYYTFPKNFSFSGEAHDFWELTYVDRGQVVIQLDGNNYMLKEGEMIFCKPNVFHKSWVWGDKHTSVVDIAFKTNSKAMKIFKDKIIVLNSVERQCMSAVMQEAAQTYTHFNNVPPNIKMDKSDNAPYGSEQIICNRLEELMIYAYREDRNIHIDNRLITSTTLPEGTDFSSWIKLYLHEHMAEKLTLENIAKKNCVSVSKLKRVFNQEAGESVISYLTALRIKEAKRLICERQYTFSQIAEKIGFESIHYFSYCFKKHTGMTASEYLKLLHKDE